MASKRFSKFNQVEIATPSNYVAIVQLDDTDQYGTVSENPVANPSPRPPGKAQTDSELYGEVHNNTADPYGQLAYCPMSADLLKTERRESEHSSEQLSPAKHPTLVPSNDRNPPMKLNVLNETDSIILEAAAYDTPVSPVDQYVPMEEYLVTKANAQRALEYFDPLREGEGSGVSTEPNTYYDSLNSNSNAFRDNFADSFHVNIKTNSEQIPNQRPIESHQQATKCPIIPPPVKTTTSKNSSSPATISKQSSDVHPKMKVKKPIQRQASVESSSEDENYPGANIGPNMNQLNLGRSFTDSAYIAMDPTTAYSPEPERPNPKPKLDRKASEPTPQSPRKASQLSTTSSLSLPGGYVPLEDLWDKSYFNMKITLAEAEEELRKRKKEGQFIVRNSRSKDGLNFAISFYSKKVNGIRHLNISYIPEANQWRLGKQERENELRFHKVTECIEHYLKNGFTLETGTEIKLKDPLKIRKGHP